MLLFAAAGSLKHTEVTVRFASYFTEYCGNSPSILVPVILAVSAVGSAFVDNVIFVAAFCPVIEELSTTVNSMPLWWALLFGACFGGNITMIGSTANIVALGMLEKRSHAHVKFWNWLKIGLASSIIACTIAWLAITFLSPYMPNKQHRKNVKTQAIEEMHK
jgi:Na+/H+ antiporter NhaD/arsenite permease-like protein